jgi:hypothetical protein
MILELYYQCNLVKAINIKWIITGHLAYKSKFVYNKTPITASCLSLTFFIHHHPKLTVFLRILNTLSQSPKLPLSSNVPF